MVYYNQTNHPSRVQKSYECTPRSVCNCTSVPLVRFAIVRVYLSFGLQRYCFFRYAPNKFLFCQRKVANPAHRNKSNQNRIKSKSNQIKSKSNQIKSKSNQIKSKSNQIKIKSNQIKIKSQPFPLSTTEPTRIRSAHTPLAIRAQNLGRYSGEGRRDTICRHPTARSPL